MVSVVHVRGSCLEFNRGGRQKNNNALALIELGFSGNRRPPS